METVNIIKHVTFLVFLTQYMICGHDTTVKNIIAERIIWQLIYFICISTFMQRQFGIRNFFIFVCFTERSEDDELLLYLKQFFTVIHSLAIINDYLVVLFG